MPLPELPTLAADAPLPKYLEIYRRFRVAIDQGQLRSGERVPSVRALAQELKVARGTVETAYQLLTSEGIFESRGQAGTVVAPLSPERTIISVSREPTVAAAPHASILPLQLGLPALDAFPRKLWARLVTWQVRQTDQHSLALTDVRGYAPLRAAIASYLALYRGVECAPEQIFVGAGFISSLTLACDALDMAGEHCWFEDPGYLHAREFLSHQGVELVPVPVDQEGLRVEEGIRRQPRARLALVTPAHQSPLGVPLSPARRRALLDWAQAHGSWVIEDDYDSEFRYKGQPLAALKSLDVHDRVIYAGSFSKMLFPGLRLGYLAVPKSLVERFEQSARHLHNRNAELLQATTATFLEQGHFTRHLKKMRQLYSSRRALLADALKTQCGHLLRVDPQAGGINMVARLQVEVADQRIADRAFDAGLAMQALSAWSLESPGERGLLMGFTNVASAPQALDIARRLQAVIEREMGALPTENTVTFLASNAYFKH